jgi:hypothetical protein
MPNRHVLNTYLTDSYFIFLAAKDFEKGYKNNIKKDETEHEFYK